MGAALATLHTVLQSLTPAEEYGVPLYPWHEVRDREIQFMPAMKPNWCLTFGKIMTVFHWILCPKDYVICDMFADNTLWDLDKGKEQLTGLLDFTEVSVEHYVMDIAITINDFVPLGVMPMMGSLSTSIPKKCKRFYRLPEPTLFNWTASTAYHVGHGRSNLLAITTKCDLL